MLDTRGELEVETLLKIVLGLIAILLALEVIAVFFGLVRMLMPVLLLAAAVLIVLWLFDRI